MVDYKLSNYLLNTYPKLLTYSALELYNRGYNPTIESKRVIDPPKISKNKIMGVFMGLMNDLYNENKNTKLNHLLSILPPNFNTSFLEYTDKLSNSNELRDFFYIHSTYILINLKKQPDPEYGNKFEYLRVKFAEP
jgi:hypothetical protein